MIVFITLFFTTHCYRESQLQLSGKIIHYWYQCRFWMLLICFRSGHTFCHEPVRKHYILIENTCLHTPMPQLQSALVRVLIESMQWRCTKWLIHMRYSNISFIMTNCYQHHHNQYGTLPDNIIRVGNIYCIISEADSPVQYVSVIKQTPPNTQRTSTSSI